MLYIFKIFIFNFQIFLKPADKNPNLEILTTFNNFSRQIGTNQIQLDDFIIGKLKELKEAKCYETCTDLFDNAGKSSEIYLIL